jgi:hypothetical protein
MLRILGHASCACDGLTRRELLTAFQDAEGRPYRMTRGTPIGALVG